MVVDLFIHIKFHVMHPDWKHFNLCIHEHGREKWAWWLREVFNWLQTRRRGSRVVSVQLKTVIIVIFTLAGDEPACPGCDTPVTGVHAWQRLGMTSPTAVRQPSFHPCPTHTLTWTEVYIQSHTFTITFFFLPLRNRLQGNFCLPQPPLCPSGLREVTTLWWLNHSCALLIFLNITYSMKGWLLCSFVSLSKVFLLSGTVLIPVEAGLTFSQLSCLQCCFKFSVTSHGNWGISHPSPLMKLIMYAEGTESR